jgi:hypothetical protein
MARFENRSFANRELSAAMVAFPQAQPNAPVAVLHTFEPVDAVNRAAMRAGRAFRPHDCLKPLESRGFVVKVFFCENTCHDRLPLNL